MVRKVPNSGIYSHTHVFHRLAGSRGKAVAHADHRLEKRGISVIKDVHQAVPPYRVGGVVQPIENRGSEVGQ